MTVIPHYTFRLYVAGEAPNSIRARSNLRQIINDWVTVPHTIEEIDLLKEPRRAQDDNIIVTPTLLMVGPEPGRRVVGNLSEQLKVVEALGLSRDRA